MALSIAALLQGLVPDPKTVVEIVRTQRTHAFVPLGIFDLDYLDAISNHIRLILF